MTAPAFDLAVVELVYFTLALLPVIYLSVVYRKPFTLGWSIIVAFLVLQISGAALIITNGKNGPPSITGTIISGVGLSPELIGTVGILHQLAHLTGTLNDDRTRKGVNIALGIFHVGVATAIPVYAIGQSKKSQVPPEENGASLAKAGILLLLLLWILSATISVWYSLKTIFARKERTKCYFGLFRAIVCSIALLGVRIVYQTVATLSDNPKYAAIGGSVAYAGCLQFLPSALAVLILVLGGFHSYKATKACSKLGESFV